MMNECFLLFLTPKTHTHAHTRSHTRRIKTLTHKPACLSVGTKYSPSFGVKRWGHQTHNEQPVSPLQVAWQIVFTRSAPGPNVAFWRFCDRGRHTETNRKWAAHREIASSELQLFSGAPYHTGYSVNVSEGGSDSIVSSVFLSTDSQSPF